MSKRLLGIILGGAALFTGLAQQTTPALKTGKRVPVKTSRARSKVKGGVAQGPPRQTAPSSDRYKEIQESLISKGYLQGPATGSWDQNSMEAMRKFQEDKKLDATGKVNAKSLISLGLGPKDESPAK